MKNYALLSLLISIISLSAQQKPFQIDIGANHSWFIFEDDAVSELNVDFKPMFTIGARYTFAEIENFTISGGFRYFVLERSLTMEERPYNSLTAETNNYLLSVPFQISYLINEINTSVILNLEPAYILESTIKDINASMLAELPIHFIEQDITNEANRFQFAIGAGLEYKFDFFDQSFGVKSIYNYFLTDIPKNITQTRLGYNKFEWVKYRAQELSFVLSYYF